MRTIKTILIGMSACLSVSACADSPIGANMNQYEFCSRHASIAMHECLDMRHGINTELLAEQIASSQESQSAQSLDLSALKIVGDYYCDPLSIRQIVLLNCMHMNFSPAPQTTPKTDVTPACPQGYVCQKEVP